MPACSGGNESCQIISDKQFKLTLPRVTKNATAARTHKQELDALPAVRNRRAVATQPRSKGKQRLTSHTHGRRASRQKKRVGTYAAACMKQGPKPRFSPHATRPRPRAPRPSPRSLSQQGGRGAGPSLFKPSLLYLHTPALITIIISASLTPDYTADPHPTHSKPDNHCQATMQRAGKKVSNKRAAQARAEASSPSFALNDHTFVSTDDLMNLFVHGFCPVYSTPPPSSSGYINMAEFSMSEEEMLRRGGRGGGGGAEAGGGRGGAGAKREASPREAAAAAPKESQRPMGEAIDQKIQGPGGVVAGRVSDRDGGPEGSKEGAEEG